MHVPFPRPSKEGEAEITDLRDSTPRDRPIGEILRRANGLTSDQIEQVLAHQRQHGVRFGDAVVALGLARPEEVMWALSQQFHYHYAPALGGRVHDELVVANRPFSDDVEVFRDLRSQLLSHAMPGPDGRGALAIASANVGDGKTFMAANLAAAFAQLPGRTLLVDADLRAPRLHEVFGLDSGIGLSGILAGRAEPDVVRPVPELPNLYLLPVGAVPPNPLELLQRPAFGLLLRELGSRFDYMLVDTPASTYGADVKVIVAECGQVLVVGRKNRTRTAALQNLIQHLSRGPAKLAGVVMNDY